MRDRGAEGRSPLYSGALRARLMMLEHAKYPRRREETLPEPFVLYPRREIFEDLRCSGKRLLRLADQPRSSRRSAPQGLLAVGDSRRG